ncbi:MAG TPA: shikimate dehydrogenase [Acidimicrobiales bacterium]|nr:shikimate dehydrogenase [Acidimicrobiales bacterium]
MTGPGLTAATRLVAVIGDPVRHSLSPTIHNAAFRALGLDWAYLALPVVAGNAAAAVEAVRVLGIEGLNVTMPHKEDVLPALDRLSTTAGALRAVNTVHRVGAELHGDNTDGAGLLDALRFDEGFDPADTRAVVFGAGGAARAVVLALARAGAADIAVVNRTAARAEEAVALAAPGQARCGGEADVEVADVVVNATPAGMTGTPTEDALLLDPRRLRPGQLVVDLVYHPLRTPLLAAAKERGAVPVTGLGMLIHQAAHAFRLWTGEDPPLEVMSAAALAALAPPT